jgi:hypothetical protein
MAKFYGVTGKSLIFENWVVEREYFTLIFNFKSMIFMNDDAVRISKYRFQTDKSVGP